MWITSICHEGCRRCRAKSPLLAQRTREKWGTHLALQHRCGDLGNFYLQLEHVIIQQLCVVRPRMQSLEAMPSEAIQLDLRRYRHVRFPTGRFIQLASAIIVSLAFCTAQTATDKQMEPDSIGAFYY